MNLFSRFENLPIRYKLLAAHLTILIGAALVGGVILYAVVQRVIEARIESELTNSTASIFKMVHTTVSVSIKNHLRGVTEKNYEIVDYFWKRHLNGELSREEAIERIREILLHQTIGQTGYIYCIDSQGTVVVHPHAPVEGSDLSSHAFIQKQMQQRNGYIEYTWKNPGETDPRAKALYMMYYEPLDWIISVSAYRDEFRNLVDASDFKDYLLGFKFGESGYAYVIDTDGKMVIHPTLEGVDILASRTDDIAFVQQMLRQRSGKILYDWKNPGEARSRRKLVIYDFIPEMNWIVATSSYQDEIYAPLSTARAIIVITVLTALLLVVPVTFWIGARITDPLKALMQRIEQASRGDFSIRATGPPRDDEPGRLSRYFDEFIERIEASRSALNRQIAERKHAEHQMLKVQKMEAVGTLAAGVAHDFNNMLGGVLGNVNLIQMGLSPDHPAQAKLRTIEKIVISGAHLARQLLGFARGGKYSPQPTDINRTVQDTLDLFARTRKKMRLQTRFEADLPTVRCDQIQIGQVLLNLWGNAADAMGDPGDLFIETDNVAVDEAKAALHHVAAGPFVRITVRDTGPGIPVEVQARLFEPFFTTKEMGKGTGLGLASAYGIVEHHGGFIEMDSRVGEGTEFRVFLPVIADLAAPGVRNEPSAPTRPAGSGTILLVDDEPTFLEIGEEMLKMLGYQVVKAANGEAALAHFKERGHSICMVILDIVMPGMSGIETFFKLREIDPGVKVLMASGYSKDEEVARVLEQGVADFIEKPFRLHELAQKIKALTDCGTERQ